MDNRNGIALARVGNPFPADNTPSTKYQHGDRLDSCNVVINAGGAFVNREEYTPYGDTSFGNFGEGYRYTGKERDEESGLYYHGARYYAPWLVRWTASDPIPPGGGQSPYAYAFGNPLRSRPNGKQPVRPKAGSAAAESWTPDDWARLRADQKKADELWEKRDPEGAAVYRFAKEHPIVAGAVRLIRSSGQHSSMQKTLKPFRAAA